MERDKDASKRDEHIMNLLIVLCGGLLLGAFIGYGIGTWDNAKLAERFWKNGFIEGHNSCGRKFMEMLNSYEVPMPEKLAKDISKGKVSLLTWADDATPTDTPVW